MKNRLQFNRIPKLFRAEDILVSGTTTHVSGRELAYEALSAYTTQRDFIPLIGEPIVARYFDDKGKKQAILAIGKATGATQNDTYGIEYHIIDTARMDEQISAATESAVTALDLASAATKSVNNYFVILRNMIEAEGIDLDNGSYFDDDDPTKDPSTCGKYKPLENSNYLDNAKNVREATWLLDQAIGQVGGDVIELSAVTIDIEEDLGQLQDDVHELSAVTAEFSSSTFNELNDIKDDMAELSAVTESFSGHTAAIIDSIINGAGLKNDGRGTYPGHDETHIIKDATSLDNADVLLDGAIWAVSGSAIELSANTVAGLQNFLDQALDAVDELSANTMAADQALQGQIDALGNRKVLGISAITTEQLENGDTKVSLVINEEDDKVLTQNTLGLKANLSLVYSSEDKKIYLKGKNDMVISEVDAKAFIKDGMLSAASVFTATEEDHQQYPELVVGKTYIKLLFNVDGEEPGRANPVFISAEDLVDTYTVAPESNTFMEIDNYVIKLNVDKENGLASYNYARNISAVTTNIISATGLNMGEQGGYPGHDDTHFIKNAGSLDQADVLLDEAIWNVSGSNLELSASVVNNENVINNILKGTGLNTDEPGEYHGHDDTHFIKDANSLDNADVILDAALWQLSGVVADIDVEGLEDKIDGLSAVTKEFSAATHTLIQELSAKTVDLEPVYRYIDENDAILSGRCDELDERVTYVEDHFTGEFIPLTNYIISSAETLDELEINSGDTVNIAFGKIQKQIIDNELVTAAALNDLDERIRNSTGVSELSAVVMSFSAATYDKFNDVDINITNLGDDITELSAATTAISENLTILSSVTSALSVDIKGLSAGTIQLSADTHNTIKELSAATMTVSGNLNYLSAAVIDNELVTAAALNNLNDKVTNLSAITITGVSIDGVPQPVADHVANLQISIPTVNGFFDGVEYDSNAKKINFYHGSDIKDFVDATDFIKDGMLSNVEVVTVSGEKYLRFTFNTDAGKEAIDIKVSEFAALYKAGSGITIESDNTIRVKLANKGDVDYLKLDGDGLYLNGITSMAGNITNLSGSVVSLSGDVRALSAACVTMSGDIDSNRTDINVLSASILDDELVIAAAFNDINDRVIELSGRTVDLSNYYTKNEVYNKIEVDAKIASGGTFDPTNYYTKNDCDTKFETKANVSVLSSATRSIYQSLNTLSSATHNKFVNLSGSVIDLSAATITGVTLNGTAGVREGRVIKLTYSAPAGGGIEGVIVNGADAPLVNNKANIGTVLSAETQLSATVTGNGNVFNEIQVSGHEIAMKKNFTAATEANLDALSGAVRSNYYTKTEINNGVSASTENLSAATLGLSAVTVTAVTLNEVKHIPVNNVVDLGSVATTGDIQNINNKFSNYYDKTEIDGMVKREFTTASSVTNLALDKYLTVVTLGNDTTLSIVTGSTDVAKWGLDNGEMTEAHVIINNTGVTGITVTLPTQLQDDRVRITGENELLVDPSGFGEVNAMITRSNDRYVIYLITSF